MTDDDATLPTMVELQGTAAYGARFETYRGIRLGERFAVSEAGWICPCWNASWANLPAPIEIMEATRYRALPSRKFVAVLEVVRNLYGE